MFCFTSSGCFESPWHCPVREPWCCTWSERVRDAGLGCIDERQPDQMTVENVCLAGLSIDLAGCVIPVGWTLPDWRPMLLSWLEEPQRPEMLVYLMLAQPDEFT